MRTFIYIIRVNPKDLNSDRITEMNDHWETTTGNLVKSKQLLEINIFRDPGAVISKKNSIVYDYYTDDNQMAVTGFLKLNCEDLDTAVELSKKMPTLLLDGLIEIRELQELKKISN